MMTAEQGWARYAGHFGIFFAIPHMVSGLAFLFGASAFWFSALVSGPLFLLVGIFVVIEEAVELGVKRQTVGKALIDLASKLSGAFLGLLTWTGWWA